jgi:DNA invertase Pin-like site-specific DNA recombinase
MERELILERTRAGLEAARLLTTCRGPKAPDDRRQGAGRPKASGERDGAQEVALSLGVSVPTLYRWVPASSRT